MACYGAIRLARRPTVSTANRTPCCRDHDPADLGGPEAQIVAIPAATPGAGSDRADAHRVGQASLTDGPGDLHDTVTWLHQIVGLQLPIPVEDQLRAGAAGRDLARDHPPHERQPLDGALAGSKPNDLGGRPLPRQLQGGRASLGVTSDQPSLHVVGGQGGCSDRGLGRRAAFAQRRRIVARHRRNRLACVPSPFTSTFLPFK